MALNAGKYSLALEASPGSQSKEEVDWNAPLGGNIPAGVSALAAAPEQRIAQHALSLAEDATAVRQGKCELLLSVCMRHAYQAPTHGRGKEHDSSVCKARERLAAGDVLVQPWRWPRCE